MGIRPSPSLLAGWDRLIVQMDRHPQNEQQLFEQILQDPHSEIRHVFLEKRKFWRRKNINNFWRPIAEEVVMIYANWMVGVKAKVQGLKFHGLFSDTSC
jgi:hypothetical protein